MISRLRARCFERLVYAIEGVARLGMSGRVPPLLAFHVLLPVVRGLAKLACWVGPKP